MNSQAAVGSVLVLALWAGAAFGDQPPPVPEVQPAHQQQQVIQVNPYLLPLVQKLLYDPKGGHREDAAEDLEKVGDFSCIPALQWSAVNDPKSGVRKHAARAVDAIGKRCPVPIAVPPRPVFIDRPPADQPQPIQPPSQPQGVVPPPQPIGPAYGYGPPPPVYYPPPPYYGYPAYRPYSSSFSIGFGFGEFGFGYGRHRHW